MKILTISEFTKALGVSKSTVSSWINRDRKLILNSDRKIDIDNPINKLHLQSQKSKGRELDFNLIYNDDKPKPKSNPKDKPKEKKESIPDYSSEYTELTEEDVSDVYDMTEEQLYKEKLRLEVVRLKNADKLDTLKIEKLEGSLIPFDAVLHLFKNAISSFHASYKLGVDSKINVFKQRFNVSHEETVLLKKELHEILSITQQDAKDELKSGAKKIVDEYSEVRGRGERK